MEKQVYKQLSSSFMAYKHCVFSENQTFIDIHEKRLYDIAENHLPAGSGFDVGTLFDFEKSRDDRLVLQSSYHPLNEAGFYEEWIDFEVVIKPSLAFDFTIDVKGRFGTRQDIKEYILDTMHYYLNEKI